ncbi:peptidoglycan DD-metalloendopeptidase family protein [Cyanobium sp. LEGE 06143]|nr:peptidoglycan DD-metalloendopeptidase family protein [Cyanobium sp. LEGE 06143]MBE9173597.1 peptidoglycan DD-metalloendopeptidase family protein [Cyanobium sp. LEGE 06143]
MKPLSPIKTSILLSAALAATVPAVTQAFTPAESDDASIDTLLAARPRPNSQKLWVKVRQPVSIDELSRDLSMGSERLANLNDVDTDHRFDRGEWLVVPAQQTRAVKLLASVDTSELRRTPPLQSPPPLQSKGVVRLGDTVMAIAQRYGLTMAELLKLNPGMQTARLVAGNEVKLVQAEPVRQRAVLGLKPSTSGGLSWPQIPGLGTENNSFDSRQPVPDGWIWPTKGVFTSGYGWRWGRMHKGIDVANNVGTPIVAARRGRVAFSGWHDGGYGYLVTLAHADGSRSLYAHNSRLMVTAGQDVAQGTLIALMGSTGRSTGPHLHFEIHPPSRGAANPLQFLPPRA